MNWGTVTYLLSYIDKVLHANTTLHICIYMLIMLHIASTYIMYIGINYQVLLNTHWNSLAPISGIVLLSHLPLSDEACGLHLITVV